MADDEFDHLRAFFKAFGDEQRRRYPVRYRLFELRCAVTSAAWRIRRLWRVATWPLRWYLWNAPRDYIQAWWRARHSVPAQACCFCGVASDIGYIVHDTVPEFICTNCARTHIVTAGPLP